MKKLLAGLLAAFLMTAGLVAASSTPASAVCGNPQYPQCFETRTGLTVSNQTPRRKAFTASVRAIGTNADPNGQFVFRIKKVGGGTSFVKRTVPKSGRVTLQRTFAKGKYNVQVSYQPPARSIFKGSRSGTRVVTIR